jgi:hypothetical protein
MFCVRFNEKVVERIEATVHGTVASPSCKMSV